MGGGGQLLLYFLDCATLITHYFVENETINGGTNMEVYDADNGGSYCVVGIQRFVNRKEM